MKKKHSKKHIFLVLLRYVVFFVLIGFIVLYVDFKIKTKKVLTYEAPAPAVAVIEPEKRDVVKTIELASYVEARDMIPVVPFVQGKILEYDIQVGDVLEKEQIIAKVDPEVYEQQVRQAQAAYNAVQKTYERVEALQKTNAVSAQNFDEVKAQLEATEAQLELAKLQLSYTDVKAPVSGTVLVSQGAEGSVASSSTYIAVMADLDQLVVNVNVPEKYYDVFVQNKDRMKVEIRKPGTDVSIKAHIEFIEPIIQPQTKMFRVKCSLDGDNLRSFTPGMYVKVLFEFDRMDDVWTLPNKVKLIDGTFYIYDPQTETVHHVDQSDINYSNSSWFVVSDKYKDFQFVVDGQNKIFDGQKVNLTEGI